MLVLFQAVAGYTVSVSTVLGSGVATLQVLVLFQAVAGYTVSVSTVSGSGWLHYKC